MTKVHVLGEFYFSQILDKPIYDVNSYKVGRLRDMAVRWDGISPIVTGIKYAKNVQNHIDINQIDRWDEKSLKLKGTIEEANIKHLQDNEIYVGKWLLDKQIIDLEGSKLVRVNDIRLSWVSHEGHNDIILLAVDIGLRGILRRIGLEFIARNKENRLVGWQYFTPLEEKTSNLQLRQKEQLSMLHAADIADIIEELDYKERADFIGSLDDQTAAEALKEVDLDMQVEIIERMDRVRASDILEEMPPDKAADILGELSKNKSNELLNLMDPEEAQDTAGALMTIEFITFTCEMTAEETINKLRELAPSAETINYMYVLNDEEVIQGVLSLRDLIIAQPQTKLIDLMMKRVVSVNHLDSHSKVISLITKYKLLALPVLDDQRKMLGIITVDDVLEELIPDRSGLETFSHFMFPRQKGWGAE